MQSDYILSEDQVNVFRHDIKPRKAKPRQSKAPATATEEDTLTWSKDVEEATPADGDVHHTTCTERWKAAQRDDLKRMWAIYLETGIFLAACRHGLIWWICDMVESGELAKYPLAIVNQALEVFKIRLGIGYDIGCSFTQTVAHSTLGPKAKENKLRFVVPAFHGYAHRRLCQLSFHPLLVTGFGLEDLETCERIFASFNGLAPTTRYSSQFHRHQSIDLYAQQHDDDKYSELSAFILNNYKQVQNILDELPSAIAALQSGKTSEETAYHQHIEAERRFLTERQSKEISYDTFACDYLQHLLEYREAKRVYDDAMEFILRNTGKFKSEQLEKRAHLMKQHAFENYERIQDMLHALELLHQDKIKTRWTPDMEEWKNAEVYLATREYQQALNKLEGLVIARLFELHKMGLSGTGYKMRTHINKALKTRCKAIQNALKKYNIAAQALNRQQLDWKAISTYGSLAEFELLHDSRSDVQKEPWADRTNREAASLSFKIERANEERVRLNVEISRLVDSMRSEESHLEACIAKLRADKSPLTTQVVGILAHRRRQNDVHRKRIQQAYRLPCYTGTRDLQESPNSASGSALEAAETVEDDQEFDADDDLLGQQQEGIDRFIGDLRFVTDT
ncbi:hypothetical protein DENSPDRAFT_880660 [Dentipellis sp. KUC8613]|nr:hypothetical protein DENSPDRAFT_880660 [Dentipellis sp. KUC8613]